MAAGTQKHSLKANRPVPAFCHSSTSSMAYRGSQASWGNVLLLGASCHFCFFVENGCPSPTRYPVGFNGQTWLRLEIKFFRQRAH